MDSTGGVYRRDTDQDPGDVGLYSHHYHEHPQALGLRRWFKRGLSLSQQEHDGTVDRDVSGSAERHRRSAGVPARERAFWVKADNRDPAKSRDLIN